jgi:hypothetical protein
MSNLHSYCYRRQLRLEHGKSRSHEIEKQRTALESRILQWIEFQAYFMPGAASYRATVIFSSETDSPPDVETVHTNDGDDLDCEDNLNTASESLLGGIKPEQFDLILPSHPASISGNFSNQNLNQSEVKVRQARLEAYLSELRRLLRIKASALLDKKAHSFGQKAGTRSAVLLASYNKKINHVHQHYEDERMAAVRLDPDGVWQQRLKELKKADVRAAHQDEDYILQPNLMSRAGRVPGEAQRQLSWIWKVPRVEPGISGANGFDTVASNEEVDEGQYFYQ